MGRQSSIEVSQEILPEPYVARRLSPEQNRTALYVTRDKFVFGVSLHFVCTEIRRM